jgi:hypothetical protein
MLPSQLGLVTWQALKGPAAKSSDTFTSFTSIGLTNCIQYDLLHLHQLSAALLRLQVHPNPTSAPPPSPHTQSALPTRHHTILDCWATCAPSVVPHLFSVISVSSVCSLLQHPAQVKAPKAHRSRVTRHKTPNSRHTTRACLAQLADK